ncbi:hypothetical protein CSW47_00060 [Thermus scotoductus]|uniref:Transposase n=1 Tax=Thermus scotoductus TaxID=37636 RepID=A0A430RHY6_THESC|nr:hypothetical protein CSW47_00060 [Thermus scotoductus]
MTTSSRDCWAKAPESPKRTRIKPKSHLRFISPPPSRRLYRLPRRASTAEEWALLEPLIPAPKPGGRPAKVSRREVVNAIQKVFP